MGEVLVKKKTGPASSHSISLGDTKTATFYQRKYCHYFVLVEKGVKNMRACCTLCAAAGRHSQVLETPHLISKGIWRLFTRL